MDNYPNLLDICVWWSRTITENHDFKAAFEAVDMIHMPNWYICLMDGCSLCDTYTLYDGYILYNGYPLYNGYASYDENDTIHLWVGCIWKHELT